MIVPEESGNARPLNLQLTPDQIMAVERQVDPDYMILRRYSEPRLGERSNAPIYQCGAGRTGLAINVHGGVTTCITSRQVIGNLLEQSFDEIWGALYGKVERRFPDGHPCATCKFRGMCSGCPALVEQLTGLPEGYVQHFCKLTHFFTPRSLATTPLVFREQSRKAFQHTWRRRAIGTLARFL